ncbi:MAG: YhbY family RNA-binding protein [Mogibacterium diversum]|jgi:putative RNA-binding protein yqeI|uniref:YhbY family RNA-binding protein n=1 Tax=Mogibacterium diversum TaxID=114527 RepID=UPI0018219E71|nr:YhbY family RNA-binding protein [Mogibacterium diversum]MBB1547249.1 YhbY family RNA-binding protein [Mogibacterium sp.]MBF1320383.1 YhbY family RNA-binding protein [Mogibacterium diversum]MBF1341377.1 YhbY family RNA-binding protein [Mogibacterium diversum]MBF1355029.1 YhbY family RNA-binding protein [Mogibacterium diversum]MBF1358807.1 YhbY family RNA-binding protein [Mogibacterium diversum]
MLTGKQRSYLKGLAQKIEPTVYIGKADLTENIVRSIDENLTANELVKCQIQEGSLLDPTEVCSELAETLHAEFVAAIGRRFVLYRRARNPKNVKIELPKAPRK